MRTSKVLVEAVFLQLFLDPALASQDILLQFILLTQPRAGQRDLPPGRAHHQNQRNCQANPIVS